MDYEKMKSLVSEFCANTSYDKTRDWRNDPRTGEDPDDDKTTQPIEPKSLTILPKALRR